jgi:glucose-1-phosphate thymidylyltransferase
MAPIAGKPIVERVIDTLAENGIREFILVTSPDDLEIADHFQNRTSLCASITLVIQPEPLGMGHALMQAVPYIHEDFVLSSCDSLAPAGEIANLLEAWKNERVHAILTTLKVGPEKITRMGIVEMDGNWIKRIIEKPSLEEAPSDIGSLPLYVFSPNILKYLQEIQPSSRGEYELQDAIQILIEREGFVRGFQFSRRIDLTTPQDLLALNLAYLNNGQPVSIIPPQSLGVNTRFVNPVQLEEGVIIGSNCVIGPNVYIEKGCRIEDEVCLEDTIVLRGRSVPEKTSIRGSVVW